MIITVQFDFIETLIYDDTAIQTAKSFLVIVSLINGVIFLLLIFENFNNYTTCVRLLLFFLNADFITETSCVFHVSYEIKVSVEKQISRTRMLLLFQSNDDLKKFPL